MVVEFDGADVGMSFSQDAFGFVEKGCPIFWVFVWEIQGQYDVRVFFLRGFFYFDAIGQVGHLSLFVCRAKNSFGLF